MPTMMRLLRSIWHAITRQRQEPIAPDGYIEGEDDDCQPPNE